MFSILDGIIIALVLLCVLIGVKRGFIGSVVRFLGGIVRIVIAVLLTKPITGLVAKSKLGEHMFDRCIIKASAISDKFSVNLVGMSEESLSIFVNDALQDAKIPKLFRGLFRNILSINPETISQHESVTLGELMGVTIGNIVLTVIVFIVLFVVLWLIGLLAKRWSKSMVGSTTILARTNRWLGGVFGLLQAAAIAFLFLAVVSLFKDFGWFNAFTTFVNKSAITGPLYRLVDKFMENSFNITKTIENWLNK